MERYKKFPILAIDCQIGLKVVEQLKQHYEIAVYASDKADEDWVNEALEYGANVFISPDLDIPNMLDQLNDSSIWIDVPRGLNKPNQFDYINAKIKKHFKL